MPRFSISRSLGYAGITTAFAIVGAITVAQIADKMVAPEFRDRALCTVGLTDLADDSCVKDRIAAAVGALKSRNDALADALRGQMVFEEGPDISNVTVVTGSIYQDHATRKGLVRAICWAIQDASGLDPRLTLAVMEADGAVRQVQIDAYEQALIGIDDTTIATARTACPWPVVS